MNVSTIIPAYNASATLKDALDSIAAQSTQPAEVIVVDAGSTDRTIEVAKAHPIKPRVVTRRRLNCGDARNLGVESAHSQWISFLDADDTWDESHLESAAGAIRESDACLYLANFRKWWADTETKEERPPLFAMSSDDTPRVIAEDELRSSVLGRNNGWHMQGMIVERNAYLDSGGCDPQIELRQDAEWFLRMAREVPWIYNPKPTWTWRFINQESLSTRRADAMLFWMRGHARFKNWLASPEYDRLMAMNAWEATRLAVMGKSRSLYPDIRRFCIPWIPGVRGSLARTVLRIDSPARMLWNIKYRA